MDDKRFDGLVKGLASGKSRRSLLKGIFGLGGAAVVGGTLLESDADAARRPTPTPKPVRCPGRQTWNGSACVCPGDAPDICGSDCCTGDTIPAPQAGHSECCDGACCLGTCFGGGECCPTNQTSGGGSPTHQICDTDAGPVCCTAEQYCCDEGCCDDPCAGLVSCGDGCCPAGQLCCGSSCYDPASSVCCSDGPHTGNCCAHDDCGFGSACCDHVCNTSGYCGNCKPNGIYCASNPECCSGWCGTGTCTDQGSSCIPEGGYCFFSYECCGSMWCGDLGRCTD